jgi:hypothetical protein
MNIIDVIDALKHGEEIDRQDAADLIPEVEKLIAQNAELRELTRQISEKTLEALKARDDAIKHLKGAATGWIYDIHAIVERMTTGGTHREKDEAQLEAIRKLMELIRAINWEVTTTAGIAADEIHKKRKNDEVPF